MPDTDATTPGLMTIGEFASRAGLSVSAVRFYGDRGLLRPAQVNESTRYRYFRHDQLPRAALIRDLRSMDMSLRDIEFCVSAESADVTRCIQNHVERLEQTAATARQLAASLPAAGSGRREQPPNGGGVRWGDFAEAIKQVAPFTSADPEYPHLMTMLIEVADSSVRVAGTDRHRLAVRDIVIEAGAQSATAVVAAATLRTWVDAVDVHEPVHITVSDDALLVAANGSTRHAALLPTTFPDYEPFLDRADQASSAVVKQQQVLQAFESFDDQGAVLMSTTPTTLRFERRDTTIEIAASCDGPAMQLGLDPTFAYDCIAAGVGNDIVIEMQGPTDPVLFRSADNGTFVVLLMPVLLTPADLEMLV